MTETVGAALRAAVTALSKAGVPGAVWEARHLTPTRILTDPGRALTRPDTYRAWIARRAASEPTGRITGFRDFRGRRFKLAPDTLDPRVDSEVLVDAVLDLRPPEKPAILADLGTGTGCLLLTLLAERPAWCGVGVDLAPGAARAAARNAARLGLSDRARMVCGFWSAALADAVLDILICNPPYIVRGDLAGLDPSVRDHDPMLALDGGADGLDAYRAVAADAGRTLRPGGLLALEIGWDQGTSVPALLRGAGFTDVAVCRDSGGRDRVVTAIAPPSVLSIAEQRFFRT